VKKSIYWPSNFSVENRPSKIPKSIFSTKPRRKMSNAVMVYDKNTVWSEHNEVETIEPR
jgi:hypothetical protein